MEVAQNPKLQAREIRGPVLDEPIDRNLIEEIPPPPIESPPVRPARPPPVRPVDDGQSGINEGEGGSMLVSSPPLSDARSRLYQH